MYHMPKSDFQHVPGSIKCHGAAHEFAAWRQSCCDKQLLGVSQSNLGDGTNTQMSDQ